jgi:FlaA1/EpsC-like NDP-sugar epimerase
MAHSKLLRNLIQRFVALSPTAKAALMVGGDAVFLPVCMLLAFAIRTGSFVEAFGAALSLQLAMAWLTIPVLATAGLYRAVVRYIDLRVLISAGASLAAAVILTYSGALLVDFSLLPRSGLLIFWFVAFSYVVTSRFLVRSLVQLGRKRPGRQRLNTAIYGAGDAGAQLAQAMNLSTEYKPVCFLDDSPTAQRKTVGGLPVYAPRLIDELVARHDLAQVVIAIPSASVAEKRLLVARMESSGLPVKILPGLVEMVDANPGVASIREVDVADLLGRDPVAPNPQLFERNIKDKTVLVTGAGGSIGSELCRQILTQRPAKLVMLDHSEYALYSIDRELCILGPNVTRVACLGSVLEEGLLSRLISDHAVQTVYHAAAYKHVPLVETNVQQGIRNNVFGSLNVVRACAQAGIETCILISTDKAVRPTNAMGASKRISELIFQAAALTSNSTVFSMVRFGNVLGSSGSVVPLFRQQIQTGGPITITHSDIIRYFMLIPEAAQLVIQAGAMARGGEVFVLDMGEPVRIADLARSMIHLSGLTEKTEENPDGDIAIEAVGLRPGEKLYEELLIGDDVIPSGHQRIMSARERHVEPSLLEKMLASLRQACDANDKESILRQVRNLVPEYRDADEVNAEEIPLKAAAAKH